MGRWKWQWEVINPTNTNTTWKVGITHALFEMHQRNGHEVALGRLLNIDEMFKDTYDIYRGWSRPGKEDSCFVYAGRPKRDHRSLSIDDPAPRGMQFLVFVLGNGAIEEYNWRVTVQANNGEIRPDKITGELLWPRKTI